MPTPKTNSDAAANHQALVEFVLEKAEDAPARRRVRIYRGLADFMGDKQQAADITALADSLDALDREAREFRFRIENPKP